LTNSISQSATLYYSYGCFTTVSKRSGYNRKKTTILPNRGKIANLKGEQVRKLLVPSAGYIGITRLDLINQLFKGKLPMEWNLKDLTDKTISAQDDIIKHRGVVHGTSRWKAITQYAIGLLEGREPENPGWVATGKTNKWPKALRHLLPVYIFIKDNIHDESYQNQIAEAMRFCLTLFKLNKVCTANSELLPLIENIGKRTKLDPALVSEFEKHVRTRLQETRDNIVLTDLDIKLFLSPSNGPNRVPKLESALEEASVLKKNQVLYKAFEKICIITGNKQFLNFFSESAKKYLNLPSKLTNIKLRKLTAIPDNGNKSRVIALCDIWTQSVLASLEGVVIDVSAKLFPNNLAYFSHKEGWNKIMSQPRDVLDRCVSLDATSWTDNFPASLQTIVVKALFGEPMSICWKALAVDCPWYVPNMPRPVKFGKGQGMGTKGSFAIAQLTDLFFIEWVMSMEYGKVPFFIKVGDDLVVDDPDRKLQSWYEAIGVPINLSKSKFKTGYGTFQEFVSRNAWNSIDYSMISPRLVARFLRNDFYALTLYYHVAERMPQHPSLEELFIQKKAVLEESKNFSLSSWEVRQKKLMKVINFLILGYNLDPKLGGKDCITLTEQETLSIAHKLIQLTIGLVTHHTALLNDDTKYNAQQALTNHLVGELREFRNATSPHIPETEGEIIFKVVNERSFTFEEAVLLQRSMIFVDKISQMYQSGTKNLSIVPRYEPVLKGVTGSLEFNPLFVQYILNIWGTLMESVTNHKVVGTNPFENRNQHQNDIELFKLVSRCFDEDNSVILDFSTGSYIRSSNKSDEIVLPKDLIDGYTRLFHLDYSLSSLKKFKSNEVSITESSNC
jgi:hypothetical protein